MKPIIVSKTLCNFSKEVEKTFKPDSIMLELALKNKDYVKVYSIQYLSRGLKIAGFVVEPKEKKELLPCIIWNRGGSRDFDAISLATCYLQLARLSLKGYIVFASQYSGGPGSEGFDDWGDKNIEDVLILKKVIEEWPGTDPKTIGMFGFSRGGMMTYRALSLVAWIRAAVISAGPTDQITAAKTRKGWREHQISLYGRSKQEQIKRSPLYWPEKLHKKTPILIMHGTADGNVQVQDSIKMAEKLTEKKIPYRLFIYEGAGHGLLQVKKESNDQMLSWFERFLKNKEPLPNLKIQIPPK